MNLIQRALWTIRQSLLPALPRSEAWPRMAVIAVNMLLVIALAHTLAKLTLAILTGEPASLTYMKTQPVTGAATDGVSASQSADVSAIGAWHLFGKAEVDRPVAASPVAVPVTPLNLRLAGIFFAEHSDGLALIADGNNLERGYRIGDLLPGGARLERIEREQVIVSRNGREELIKLPKLDDPGRPLLVLAPESPPALLVPAEEPGPVAFSGPQVIDASAIAERLRGEVLSQPQALEDIAFANPYMQNGSFAGFRLRPGRDRQIFQQLGLSSGDILTEINGTRLSSPAQGLALLQELMSARQINVRIQRNGAEIPLTFILDGS